MQQCEARGISFLGKAIRIYADELFETLTRQKLVGPRSFYFTLDCHQIGKARNPDLIARPQEWILRKIPIALCLKKIKGFLVAIGRFDLDIANRRIACKKRRNGILQAC